MIFNEDIIIIRLKCPILCNRGHGGHWYEHIVDARVISDRSLKATFSPFFHTLEVEKLNNQHDILNAAAKKGKSDKKSSLPYKSFIAEIVATNMLSKRAAGVFSDGREPMSAISAMYPGTSMFDLGV